MWHILLQWSIWLRQIYLPRIRSIFLFLPKFAILLDENNSTFLAKGAKLFSYFAKLFFHFWRNLFLFGETLFFCWWNFIWRTSFGETSFGKLHLVKLHWANLYLAKLHLAMPILSLALQVLHKLRQWHWPDKHTHKQTNRHTLAQL